VKGFILDASLALEWFNSGASREVLAKRSLLEDHVALVPHTWRFEVMNVIATWRKRGEITDADSTWVLNEILHTPSAIVDEGSADSIVSLALHYNLSAYDSTYLNAAMTTGEPLATLDRTLISAAKKAGVHCL